MIVTSEEQKRKLFDIDSAYNKVAALAADELFIKGFVMGYRFLKELNNSKAVSRLLFPRVFL
jgi:hypothetical protein